MDQELREGKAHVRFCVEIYKMQIQAKRHFVHEHPEKSKAWQMPEIMDLMLKQEVDSVVLHMCAFGMTAKDDQGKGLVKKATRIMSSSAEILKRVNKKCTNADCKEGRTRTPSESAKGSVSAKLHRHVHLISGRAKAAQVYPRQLRVLV